MDTEIIFRILLAALLILFIGHRGYYTQKARRLGGKSIEQSESPPTHPLVNLLFLLALASTILYIFFPSWIAWASLPFPGWLRWAGAGLAGVGFILLQWSQNTLGKNWSDTPRLLEEQTLVTDGPYRWVRNPIYTAFLMILSAPLFISANWFIGIAWIASTYLDVTARINYEEKIMIDHFGDPYREYMQKTGRLLPKGGY